ncbi:MAG: hypothetical protein ABTD50_11490 [Polyangiaceae bacterium]
MRIAYERLSLWSALVVVATMCGCASNGSGAAVQASGTCDAGAVATCQCSDGTSGTQVCNPASSTWDACPCASERDSSASGVDGTVGPDDGGGSRADATSSSGASASSSSGGTSTGSSGGMGTSSGAAGTSSGGSAGGSSSGSAGSSSGAGPDDAGAGTFVYDWDVAPREAAAHPPVEAGACGASWAVVDNVCCGQYCSNDNTSADCSQCDGGMAMCVPVNSKGCVSGQWPEVHSLSDDEPWHYSRSTHFGETTGGACQFGYYGVCSSSDSFNQTIQGCQAFCGAYPDLCAEPDGGILLRGNFAAPGGNYYTQFWSSLPGNDDNYLSCGECFELVRTQDDGTDYAPTDPNYTPPILLQVVDSCPCAPNSKWCCGSGRDHCGEIMTAPDGGPGFKYGCPLPPGPPPPAADHDPLPNESFHLDLSDVAMSRLQTGVIGGNMTEGVIPTRYQRVPCPVPGNVYLRILPSAGPYYFALTVVNVRGFGSVVSVEAQLPSGDWVALVRDQNYTAARPQERSGDWVIPQGAGPFQLPVTIRITDPGGTSLVASDAIKSWTSTDDATPYDAYYIDTGVQF